jgi:hypothetical protein
MNAAWPLRLAPRTMIRMPIGLGIHANVATDAAFFQGSRKYLQWRAGGYHLSGISGEIS